MKNLVFDLLRVSIMGSISTFLILLIKQIAGKKFDARWHYLIWFLLLIRLAIPYSVESPLSLNNIYPDINAAAITAANSGYNSSETPKQVPALDKEILKSNQPEVQKSKQAVPAAVKTIPAPFNMSKLLFSIWLFGFMAMIFFIIHSNLLICINLRRYSILRDMKCEELIQDCRRLLKIKAHPVVVETKLVASPAIFGIVSPKLLIPEGCLAKMNREELKYAFLHEMAHFKRMDILVNMFSSLLQAVHWFNPLIWYAFIRMRKDRETACDACVLNCLPEGEYLSYGRTLINMAEQLFSRRMPFGLAGFLQSKKDLKRRVSMITAFKKNKYKWSLIPLIIILATGFFTLSNSAIPQTQTASSYTEEISGLMQNNGYNFEDDQAILGRWEYVGFVESIDKFSPSDVKTPGFMYTELEFIKGGAVFSSAPSKGFQVACLTWTKGKVLSPEGFSINYGNYQIKEIDGDQYLFFEWVTQDYTVRHIKPELCVFRRLDNKDYSKANIVKRRDNTNHIFIYDSKMAGTWKCVDFVSTISYFKPGTTRFKDTLMFKELKLSGNGAVTATSASGKEYPSIFVWTKGRILAPKEGLSMKAEIKEIGGKTYMFYEFKNGDYVYRGAKPNYYVFEKV